MNNPLIILSNNTKKKKTYISIDDIEIIDIDESSVKNKIYTKSGQVIYLDKNMTQQLLDGMMEYLDRLDTKNSFTNQNTKE